MNRSEGTTLAIMDSHTLMPVLSLQQAADRYNAVVAYVSSNLMKKDVDYGIIPGTPKPTLLKPGAEKLCTLFGLTSRFDVIKAVEDWTGKDHNGEPFFYYVYHCELYRGSLLVSEADGSCNSWEKKYRWRSADRLCPHCNKPTIIKGREEYGGGWLCFAKKGGCGAKFRDGDETIEGQTVGLVPNPDAFDQVNTIQKMAQKRALIGAVLLAVNASEFFTQDLEDVVVAGYYREAELEPEPFVEANPMPVVEPQPTSNWVADFQTKARSLGFEGDHLKQTIKAAGFEKWHRENVDAMLDALRQAAEQTLRRPGQRAVSRFQRQKMVELYGELYPDSDAVAGVDEMFQKEIGYGLDQASYDDGRQITAMLLRDKRNGASRQSVSAPPDDIEADYRETEEAAKNEELAPEPLF